jgi:UDP-2,3-diacylglucosamine pyrophosphatase LpxH
MRILFMSDFHLGSPLFNPKDEVISLLNSHAYDHIFLIGDIIDEWEGDITYTTIENDKLLDEINKFNNITIIKGNHDPSIKIMETIFPNKLIVDKYEYIIDGKKAIMVHGDEFDFMVTKYSWLAKLFFPLHWLLERFGLNLKGFLRDLYCSLANKRDKKYFNKLLLSVETELVNKYGDEYDYIIVGHTHMPKVVNLPNCKYINCGDWIHNRTHVLYENGLFILRGDKNVL